jgi:hypothetical protein
MIQDGLTRHDLFHRPDDGSVRDGVTPKPRSVDRMSFGTARVVPGSARHDEPTGDAAGPRRSFRSRLDGRTRRVLTGAAVAVVIVNAGAAWAYWRITGAETGRVDGGAVVELNQRGRSDLNVPLTPGGTGDLIVTVTNDNDFPLRITSVSPGADKVVADVEHRENGCVDPGVTVAVKRVSVRWHVTRNNVAAYTVPNGLTMAASADPACRGAIFTVPVLVSGVAGVS